MDNALPTGNGISYKVIRSQQNVMERHFEYGIRVPRDGGIHAGGGGGGARHLGLVTFAANG